MEAQLKTASTALNDAVAAQKRLEEQVTKLTKDSEDAHDAREKAEGEWAEKVAAAEKVAVASKEEAAELQSQVDAAKHAQGKSTALQTAKIEKLEAASAELKVKLDASKEALATAQAEHLKAIRDMQDANKKLSEDNEASANGIEVMLGKVAEIDALKAQVVQLEAGLQTGAAAARELEQAVKEGEALAERLNERLATMTSTNERQTEELNALRSGRDLSNDQASRAKAELEADLMEAQAALHAAQDLAAETESGLEMMMLELSGDMEKMEKDMKNPFLRVTPEISENSEERNMGK